MLTSHLSAGQWWIAAIVSGLALGLAARSTATALRDRLIAWSLPPVGALAIAGRAGAQGEVDRARRESPWRSCPEDRPSRSSSPPWPR